MYQRFSDDVASLVVVEQERESLACPDVGDIDGQCLAIALNGAHVVAEGLLIGATQIGKLIREVRNLLRVGAF